MQKIKEITAKPLHFNQPIDEFNIAIIVSRFNQDITEGLLNGALQRLQELNFPERCITIIRVPGAVEIGLAAQQIAISNENCLAIICLGAVIRGKTNHYDYVCQQVSYACQKVALQESIPVIFGILTTENEEQAFARIDEKHCHKGRDAVDAAMEMISVLEQIEAE
ncbi:MAG: 6,7-dimethyl-8-ribityllumazine synthase [Gammaproteobacteria bacterium]|nr:MAG: 6,7-dimethyl-8-ribityllumazine synthase [Gammaproteobacteria bacterium]